MKNNKNAVYGIAGAGLALVLFCVMFAACPEPGPADKEKEDTSKKYITISVERLEFGPYEETRMFSVTTNAGSVEVSKPSWCTVNDLGNNSYSVKVSNYSGVERTGAITLTSEEAQLTVNLPVAQSGNNRPAFTGSDDVKITVSSAIASSQQNSTDQSIQMSYDGKMDTHYHSSWSNTRFPVRLTYNFAGVPGMDYLMYYVRTSGDNGKFQELEIWVADNGSSDLRKYGDYNFNGGSARVGFVPPLVNPTQVEFRVKSGVGGFASCAEMEFYRKAEGSFDYLTVFADPSCSSLKEGVTREAIDAIPDLFFKDMALKIFLNIYDNTGFRAQEYRAWVHPDAQNADHVNKASPYSLRDNPTGIYIKKDEDLLVFAGNTQGQSLSLVTQYLPDYSTGGWGVQNTYPLAAGMNKIKAKANGLIYLQYYSAQGENAPKVKINFATGAVNGYFDSQKHSAGDWSKFLNAATAPDFDLLGKSVHLTFPVEKFKAYTPDGKALVDEWDRMVQIQHDFMGLNKYNRAVKNRIYCHVDYDPNASYMYATSYHTGYSIPPLNDILDAGRFKTNGIWGPAHEVGHVHQLQPGLRWIGMTEVTNNIYSLYSQTTFGNTSRLTQENKYVPAFNVLLEKNISHNDAKAIGNDAVWRQLVPFWQLKLYLCDVLGKTDFYKDLFEEYRTQPNPGTAAQTDGRFQLHFVRTACKIANLDLTEFFEKWGFLTPVDLTVNDYSSNKFTVTQAQVDALKAEIAGKNYPKPPKDFTRITDTNKDTYK